jgi:hypothetical protein
MSYRLLWSQLQLLVLDLVSLGGSLLLLLFLLFLFLCLLHYLKKLILLSLWLLGLLSGLIICFWNLLLSIFFHNVFHHNGFIFIWRNAKVIGHRSLVTLLLIHPIILFAISNVIATSWSTILFKL